MSLFSRLFRKAPSPSPVPASAPAKSSTADRALAAAADESALRTAMDAGDTQAVARLVVAGASTRIRQAAAEAIEDPDVLRQLIREVRGGNDNSVYKVLTSKRDALLEQARQREQLRAEIHAAAEALERHSQRPYDPLYSPKLEQFERRWEAVAAQADPELRDSARQWIARSREIIAEPLRQAAARALREQADANAAAEARRLSEQQAQASAAAQAAAAQAALVEEQKPVVEEQKPALSEAQQAAQQTFREIGELVRKARAALSGGSTSRAASVRGAVEEKLAGAPPLPARLVSQLQQLDQQLDELKDWKSFSVTPKRAELIEEMEALVGADFDPPELADRIKRLKEEWRTLGKGVGTSAGTHPDPTPDADAQRFQAAAQKAYQPCAEYFAAQALVHAENLRRREALLDRLTAFEAGTHGEAVDWQAVIRTLRETKQEWRSHSPVDRKASKQQHAKFEALAAGLQGRLDLEYARNVKQKEALIERAQALLASDDNRKAIDAIKALQPQWKAVGPVPREIDQRLWGSFRQHCDAVFQKRQQELAAHTAGQENNKAQALALCEQIEQIAALEGAELLARAAALAELRSAFDALGEFPRADAREIRNRLDRALDRCAKAVARHHARDAEQAWEDLFEAANHVRAYRLAAARNLDAAQLASLKAAAESRIASVQRWPRAGLEALKQALANEPSADLAANEATLKMLCIRAEILSDLPTPPEDQPLRREYQLQRLVQSMGQRSSADEASLDALAIEWLDVGPVDDATYASLLQRFQRCRERGNSRAA